MWGATRTPGSGADGASPATSASRRRASRASSRGRARSAVAPDSPSCGPTMPTGCTSGSARPAAGTSAQRQPSADGCCAASRHAGSAATGWTRRPEPILSLRLGSGKRSTSYSTGRSSSRPHSGSCSPKPGVTRSPMISASSSSLPSGSAASAEGRLTRLLPIGVALRASLTRGVGRLTPSPNSFPPNLSNRAGQLCGFRTNAGSGRAVSAQIGVRFPHNGHTGQETQ